MLGLPIMGIMACVDLTEMTCHECLLLCGSVTDSAGLCTSYTEHGQTSPQKHKPASCVAEAIALT